MLIVAAMVLCAALIPLSGGDVRELAKLRLTNESAVLLVFALQGLARGRFSRAISLEDWSVVCWGALGVALLVLLWPDRRRVGISVVMLGTAANLLVVLANGRMPVAASCEMVLRGGQYFYQSIDPSAVFATFADVLPAPGGSLLFSLGDVLLWVGATTVVISGASRSRAWGSSDRDVLQDCTVRMWKYICVRCAPHPAGQEGE